MLMQMTETEKEETMAENWFPGTEGTHYAGVAIPEVCQQCGLCINPDDDDEGEGCECAAEEERDSELRKAWADYEFARSQYHHLRRS